MQRNLVVAILVLVCAAKAMAQEPISALVPNAKVVGEGRLSMAFWDIYDATLYAPSGELAEAEPYALSIRYMREIDGSDIADRSVQEIRGQGFQDEIKLAAWNSQMKTIFPNVENGTVLSAIFIPGKETIFFHADKPIGSIKDADFTRWFSNIWLGENTSEPDLRRKLLGQS